MAEAKPQEFYQWVCARTKDEALAMIASGKQAIKFLPSAAEKGKSKGRHVEEICSALRHNTRCKALSLSRNNLSSSEAEIVAELLLVNHDLVLLNLSHNSMGDAGAKSLARALKLNASLRVLNLCSNCLGDEGAESLLETLRSNTTLLSLKMANNVCDKSIFDEVKARLKMNNMLVPRSGESLERIPNFMGSIKRKHQSNYTSEVTTSAESVNSRESTNPMYSA